MSDHWNGIANLLGTPSLNPQKKPDSAEKTTKQPAEKTEPEVSSQIPAEPKPSRMRSSWDAVAQFFGVASPEPPVAPIETRTTPVSTSAPSSPKTRKSKPSMWGPSEVESPSSTPVSEKSGSSESKVFEEAIEPKEHVPASRASRSVAERSTERSTERTKVRPESRGPRENRDRMVRESDSDGNQPVERRSSRRPPRRGQQPSQDEARVEMEARDPDDFSFDQGEKRISTEERKRPSEERPNRRVRGESKPTRSSLDSADDPSSSDRPSEARGQRDKGRRDKKQREPERSPKPSQRQQNKPARDTEHWDDIFEEPASVHRGRASEFGAGIQDEIPFSDIDDSQDSSNKYFDSSSEDEKEVDLPRSESHAKSNRRRGKRSNRDRQVESESNAASRSDDTSEEVSRRNAKIPSWHDAIGSLITANMENHQRNQGSHRGSRGRGPRRDR